MTSVRFLGPDTDAYVASVERHASEFVERTGIELDVRIVPSDLYFSNRIEHLLDGDDAADVYMSGPVLLWEHLASGFVQPLDDLLERASDAYEAEDFVEPLLRCNRWSGRFGDPLGNGPLLEIPVTASRTTSPTCPMCSSAPASSRPAPGRSTSRRRARSCSGRAARCAASRSGAPAPGTLCTRGSRRSSGRTAAATSSTDTARSHHPNRSERPRTSSPGCVTPARRRGPSSAGMSWRSTSGTDATA